MARVQRIRFSFFFLYVRVILKIADHLLRPKDGDPKILTSLAVKLVADSYLICPTMISTYACFIETLRQEEHLHVRDYLTLVSRTSMDLLRTSRKVSDASKAGIKHGGQYRSVRG